MRSQAAVTISRSPIALSIEPKPPDLWHEMPSGRAAAGCYVRNILFSFVFSRPAGLFALRAHPFGVALKGDQRRGGAVEPAFLCRRFEFTPTDYLSRRKSLAYFLSFLIRGNTLFRAHR